MKIARAIAQAHPEQARAATNKLLPIIENSTLREQAEATMRQIDGPQEQSEDE